MKKNILFVSSILALSILSCKQEPKMPSDEEIAQKVTDKYGAELTTLQELKQMQCNETLNQKVSEQLAATATPSTK
jgi:hypothetical protein